GLQAFARAGGSGFVWLFHKVGSIFSWLLQWFPSSDEPGDLPEMQQGESFEQGQMEEQLVTGVDSNWILLSAAIIAGLVLLGFFAYFLKRWQQPQLKKESNETTFRQPWYRIIWKWFSRQMQLIRVWWRRRFSRFYKQQVFWDLAQVQ